MTPEEREDAGDASACQRCGAPATVTIEMRGLVHVDLPSCAHCRDESLAEFAALRSKFNEMIDAGVSRETANGAMIRWHVPRALAVEVKP